VSLVSCYKTIAYLAWGMPMHIYLAMAYLFFLMRNIRCFFNVFLVFFFNCDTTFKITNILKVNKDNFKFNDNFKSHITIKRTSRKY
jgi:hypothetical protein